MAAISPSTSIELPGEVADRRYPQSRSSRHLGHSRCWQRQRQRLRKTVSHAVQRVSEAVAGVKNIIAVASGKGASARARRRSIWRWRWPRKGPVSACSTPTSTVPSQPQMLGIAGSAAESRDGKSMDFAGTHGMQVMSIGFLIDTRHADGLARPDGDAGARPDAERHQLARLDYLVVDMPPGTGDTQLTLAQKVPVTGAVIVTTPQDIKMIDAKKGPEDVEKVGVPILGIVEDMASHICSNCGHGEHIFRRRRREAMEQ